MVLRRSEQSSFWKKVAESGSLITHFIWYRFAIISMKERNCIYTRRDTLSRTTDGCVTWSVLPPGLWVVTLIMGRCGLSYVL